MKAETLDDRITLMCAFRYALGRQSYAGSSYAVSSVVNAIIENWGQFDANENDLFKREIRAAIEAGHAGADMDIKQWTRILRLGGTE